MFRLIKAFLRLIVLVFIIGGLILAYSRYIEPFHLRIEEVTITSHNIPEKAEGLRIIAFADTHFGEYYTTQDFKNVIEAIHATRPDMVVFLGDLIDHYKEYTKTNKIEEISELLSEIYAPMGKYAVSGNHDYGGGAENIYSSIMYDGGFIVLKNDSILLEDIGVQLIGIDDMIIGYGDPSTAEEAQSELYNIVLSHAPDVANQFTEYNVDLVLSGHTHGRQVNLSCFDEIILPRYGREYIRGLYNLNNERNTRIYVNTGVGMTQLPLRFLSPPELTIITLKAGPEIVTQP